MKNIMVFWLLSGVVLFSACAKKEIYYFNKMSPPHHYVSYVEQKSNTPPPLYQPKKSRKSIRPDSQYFTLAIPNCIDMTGLALDLRKSLADMLYTEIFKTNRFNLYDRDQLQELDSVLLERTIFKKKQETAITLRLPSDDQTENEASGQTSSNDSEEDEKNLEDVLNKKVDMLQSDARKELSKLNELKENTDGLLWVYITSKILDEKKKKGKIQLEYRIVSTRKKVLFAGTHKVDFSAPTAKDLSYNREDIQKIAQEIFQIFPNPKTTRKAEVISVDVQSGRIVMDFGKNQHIIPGLRGYVAVLDDSIYTSDEVRAEHYKYLAKFEITEVYDKTSVGVLLDRWDGKKRILSDVQVGDKIILK